MKCKDCNKDYPESEKFFSTTTGVCKICCFNKKLSLVRLDIAKRKKPVLKRTSTQTMISKNKLRSEKPALNRALSQPTIQLKKFYKPVLKRTLTQEIISMNKLERTNSLYFDNDYMELEMKPGFRNYQGGKEYVREDGKSWADALIISIFSLEASESCARQFHENLENNRFYNMKIDSEVTPEVKEKLAKNVTYTKDIKCFKDGIEAVLKNKKTPHVIPVIEGGWDNDKEQHTIPNNFDIVDIKGDRYEYTLSKFHILGKKKVNKAPKKKKDNKDAKKIPKEQKDETYDAKQNMHFYIRNDMQKAITIIENDKVLGDDSNFRVAEIQFETDHHKYSILIVHIPNQHTTTVYISKDTHERIKRYCERTDITTDITRDRTVVGYIGDTNFKYMIQSFSSPSYGGNQGKFFMSPTSSGAAVRTYYMQAIAVNDKNMSFAMGQPTTLNLVKLNISDRKEQTDHPSIQTVVLLDSKIKDRI